MGLNTIGSGGGLWGQNHGFIPVALGSGQLYTPKSGQYLVALGPYTFLQVYDGSSQIWRNFQVPTHCAPFPMTFDGANMRLANLTGGMVGAVITNGGSGYTNGIYPAGTTSGTLASPQVVVSAGGGTVVATCNMIIGGSISTTAVIGTAGKNYTRPPLLIVSPPPAGGVQATMYTTLSSGVPATPTVTNAGAGYTVAPTVTVINAPDDTTGVNLVVTTTLDATVSGKLIALTMANNGAGMTSVPTFTFSPNPATVAATAIMCFTITAGVAQTSATHMGTGNIGWSIGGLTAGSNITTNPAITTAIFTPRPAYTAFNTTSTGGVTWIDGGLHQIIPTGIAYSTLSDGTISAAATAVAQTVGGANPDTTYLLPL